MLTLPAALRVYLCVEPTDMRKSFDTLAALVRDKLALDPLSGQLFVFRSRRGDRVKLLFWDGDGYALWYKRLELGSFRFPAAAADAVSVKISAGDFRLLLDGVDLTSVRRGKRYRREA
jgi:transposase